MESIDKKITIFFHYIEIIFIFCFFFAFTFLFRLSFPFLFIQYRMRSYFYILCVLFDAVIKYEMGGVRALLTFFFSCFYFYCLCCRFFVFARTHQNFHCVNHSADRQAHILPFRVSHRNKRNENRKKISFALFSKNVCLDIIFAFFGLLFYCMGYM